MHTIFLCSSILYILVVIKENKLANRLTTNILLRNVEHVKKCLSSWIFFKMYLCPSNNTSSPLESSAVTIIPNSPSLNSFFGWHVTTKKTHNTDNIMQHTRHLKEHQKNFNNLHNGSLALLCHHCSLCIYIDCSIDGPSSAHNNFDDCGGDVLAVIHVIAFHCKGIVPCHGCHMGIWCICDSNQVN